MARSVVKRVAAAAILVCLLLVVLALSILTRNQALDLIYNPLASRMPVTEVPRSDYLDVQVTTDDGNTLNGWYIPSTNGAAVIMVHGYKNNRTEFLEEAEMLARHGYGALFATVRAHDINEGDIIGFGLNEMADLDAWYQFMLSRDDVDVDGIGMLGNSMGGSMVIQYSAGNEDIQAVVAHSAFSSMEDTIATSVSYFTGLPPFPFAPLIGFWAERELDASIQDIDATRWIGDISPRPVFILHSDTDSVVSPESGALLFDAARAPKEIWLESGLGHANFDLRKPAEFEERVIGFFDRYLLGSKNP